MCETSCAWHCACAPTNSMHSDPVGPGASHLRKKIQARQTVGLQVQGQLNARGCLASPGGGNRIRRLTHAWQTRLLGLPLWSQVRSECKHCDGEQLQRQKSPQKLEKDVRAGRSAFAAFAVLGLWFNQLNTAASWQLPSSLEQSSVALMLDDWT